MRHLEELLNDVGPAQNSPPLPTFGVTLSDVTFLLLLQLSKAPQAKLVALCKSGFQNTPTDLLRQTIGLFEILEARSQGRLFPWERHRTRNWSHTNACVDQNNRKQKSVFAAAVRSVGKVDLFTTQEANSTQYCCLRSSFLGWKRDDQTDLVTLRERESEINSD